MKLNTLFKVTLLICCYSSQVFAGDADHLFSKTYNSCMDKSGGVTTAMLTCIDVEVKSQDARLNTTYKALFAKLNAKRKSELKGVQNTWIKFRDLNCKFYSDPEAGTSASVSAASCVLSMTAERATELEQFLSPG